MQLSELINDEELKVLRRAEIIEQFYMRMNIPFLKYMICLGCKLTANSGLWTEISGGKRNHTPPTI